MGRKEITLGFVGGGGDGIVTSGEMLVYSAAADGIYSLMLKSFGPQIRGGESSCQFRISQEPILTQGDHVDVLAILGWEYLKQFEEEVMLRDGVTIFYDEDDPTPENALPIDPALQRTVYRVPFKKIAQDVVGTPLARNIVMLGVLCEKYNIPAIGIEKGLRKKFAKKGEDVVNSNLKALWAGREYAREHIGKTPDDELVYTKGESKLVLDGNTAVAYGALVAGCDLFAGYPITPSSEIMQWLSVEMPRFDRVFIQVEDEIAAINMVIGASYAGKKAMTVTSGPGVSLMNEGLGLAVMAELPCVVVNVQRGGPSTGIPTKSEQADLLQAAWGAHGDAPKAVLAATDVEDCFIMTIKAFNIAEKYQLPVILLTDQFLGHRKECVDRFDLSKFTFEKRLTPTPEELEHTEPRTFKRFEITEDWVSKITHPGMKNGQYLVSGLSHTESGSPASTFQFHEQMHEKHYRKWEQITQEPEMLKRYGLDDAEIGLITWGSSKGAIKEAVLKANREGHKVSACVPLLLYPLPEKQLNAYFKSLKALIVVELSYTAQFHRHLRSYLDLPAKTLVCKRSGPMPFRVEEVYAYIQQAIQEGR